MRYLLCPNIISFIDSVQVTGPSAASSSGVPAPIDPLCRRLLWGARNLYEEQSRADSQCLGFMAQVDTSP